MARSLGLPGLVCVLVAALLAAAASATQFRVGGQKGWSVPDAGAEPYNTWAGRLRFQIGDQLLFVYPKETDSVLLVDAAAYNACNTSSYLTRFDDGSTVFTLDRSGPFFFISGNDASCRANEKLIVVVLAPRTPPAMTPQSPPPSAPPAPSPTSSPPPSGGAAPLPAPAATPTSPPAPSASVPAPAPAATPTASPPPAPAPASTPTSSPPAPAGQAPPPSTTPGGASQPPSASANAPGAGGSGSSTTPPPPSASGRSAVAGLVGSLTAFVGYAMLAA
ncbi:hypothetical protein U9M48_026537 [Paspalum notatum var. saurae]|uniref:Phytocyanin domain-containing protein n=1 Tax=Paspalum notatum var. saurae TaxID=547442 RepID=A0AAQ3TVH4_PASNO